MTFTGIRMSPFTIQTINFSNNQITVIFKQSWFQEDINTLHQLLLGNISDLSTKEVIIGADLEHIRFQWQGTEFTLHFEYYSQSCWLDTQEPKCQTEITSLFNLLEKSHKNNV